MISVFYYVLSITRRIDGDEGYFLYAGRCVLEGRLPYRDFFFPQMPLFPYLLAMVGKLFGNISWFSGRMTACLASIVCACAMWILLRRRISNHGVLASIFVLYLVSDFGLEWTAAVKVYGPTTSFLLLAACIGTAGDNSRPIKQPWLTGLAVGLLASCAVLVRLTSLPIAILVCILSRLRQPEKRTFTVASILVGWIPALVVMAFFYIFAGRAVIFDNWIYHSLGEPETGERIRTNLQVLLEMFLVNSWWLPAVALLIFWTFKSSSRGGLDERAYLLFFFVTIVVSTIPIRAYHQYYSMGTPWLILAISGKIDAIFSSNWPGLSVKVRRALILVCAFWFAFGAYGALQRRWPNWTLNPSTPEASVEFDHRIQTVKEISRTIDRIAGADDLILTWWPGYGVETNASLVPGTENHFGPRVERFRGSGAARELKILTTMEIENLIAQRVPRAIVLGIWTGLESEIGSDFYRNLALSHGYRLEMQVGLTEIYRY